MKISGMLRWVPLFFLSLSGCVNSSSYNNIEPQGNRVPQQVILDGVAVSALELLRRDTDESTIIIYELSAAEAEPLKYQKTFIPELFMPFFMDEVKASYPAASQWKIDYLWTSDPGPRKSYIISANGAIFYYSFHINNPRQ